MTAKSQIAVWKSALKPLVSPFLQKWRGSRPSLDVDESHFREFREPLRKSMLKVARTRFYKAEEQSCIAGWMTPRERQMLYALARWLPGPIVEIGSWVGLSTTAIARGIKDASTAKKFDTFDLNLTTENFKPVSGGIGMFLHDDNRPRGICSEESYKAEILPVLSSPGGPTAMLRTNLDRFGLTKFVDIHIGDFKDFQAHPCGFVFCDALHNVHEIAANGPSIRALLPTGSVLACHDIGTDVALIAALREILPLGHSVTVDSLLVAEIV